MTNGSSGRGAKTPLFTGEIPSLQISLLASFICCQELCNLVTASERLHPVGLILLCVMGYSKQAQRRFPLPPDEMVKSLCFLAHERGEGWWERPRLLFLQKIQEV